jgi:uncharacterized protein (TIGR00725 family)
MNTKRKLQVVVIGDAQADKEKFDFCEKLGKYLGEKGYTVITGGGTGVMEAVSKGACSAGGITVGILPSNDLQDANRWCNIVVPTGMGHARNSLTALSADIIISIGGKAGTLTELGFAWIYNKPIIAVTLFGGWSESLADQKIDNRRTEHIIAVDSLDELKNQVDSVANILKKD